MAAPKVSVILGTFDQTNALTYSLIGYRRQSFQDFEIVVADDGSDEETKQVVDAFRETSGFLIKHVWQENRGFRRAKIANAAVRQSEGEILLFSDGDCIPHRDFVKWHAESSGPGRFSSGGYVRLSPAASQALTRDRVAAGDLEKRMPPAAWIKFRWTHFKNGWGVLIGNPVSPRAYGCNLSCGRDVYAAVNGFDENFDGFGREDSDLRNRMRRWGARPVSLWCRTWVYHVNDVIDPTGRRRRIPRRKNLEYFARPEIPVYCENGLVKKSTGR
ncbi:MAG: glycosyltransferase [Planctomycetes bacterium]|nr:glycosyltransferase [Planctomycetota bacterium]